MDDLISKIELLNKMNFALVMATLEKGKQLESIKSNKLFLEFASHVKNWIDFLKEIDLAYNDAEQLIGFYNLYKNTEEERLMEIPIKRLESIVKFKEYIPDIELMLDNASLPEKDWKDELNKLKGYRSYIECNHEGNNEEWIRCCDCGRWTKV